MDWAHPLYLLWILPAAACLCVLHRTSLHPMPLRRRRWLLAVRISALFLLLLALASPALSITTEEESVILILDHSQSLGPEGMAASVQRVNALLPSLAATTRIGILSAGASTKVLRPVGDDRSSVVADPQLAHSDGSQTDLAGAISLASGLFPPGTTRRLVLISDGMETRGDAREAAREAALQDIRIDVLVAHGPARPDARVVRLRASRARAHEGATIALTAELESSVDGEAQLRLFENGIEVERRTVRLAAGELRTEVFQRTPEERNLYRYLVRLEGFPTDAIPQNDEAMSLVEVRGRPLLLLIEGEAEEAHYLRDAMAKEGIRLHLRPPEAFPESLQALAAYDGVILSDVPARRLGEQAMTLIHDYVERLGGGLLMIGGLQSFGVGGYYRTPIEDVLPVRMQPPDTEERYSTALCLVIDRSGSMGGTKIELCKSAASATAEMLRRKDFLGVVAFDSRARWIVPMTRVSHKSDILARIAMLNAGGGTNIHPGMTAAHAALRETKARVKHMIVLSDGQTTGGGYRELAAQCRADNITVSTVGVGHGAANTLLATIAEAGGGKHYATVDPSSIPRIFTQDTATHLGQLIREQAFRPQQVESHPMLSGWTASQAPRLLGYVKTLRKATTQVPLVTDIGDPLLAHWRFGLGKVTAFTSDCKSRWAALWIAGWPGYSQFWGQVLREMARNPQGRGMDIRIERDPRGSRIVVDVFEDAASFKNAAHVAADVYFVPRGALGSALRKVRSTVLEQVGPGRYEALFRPDKPGVYLVRARSGSDLVSAGLVHEVSGETASARVDRGLLEDIAASTGGVLLEDRVLEDRVPGDPHGGLPPHRAMHVRFLDLTPWLITLFLLLFLVDLGLRRWENVLGLWDGTLGRYTERHSRPPQS